MHTGFGSLRTRRALRTIGTIMHAPPFPAKNRPCDEHEIGPLASNDLADVRPGFVAVSMRSTKPVRDPAICEIATG